MKNDLSGALVKHLERLSDAVERQNNPPRHLSLFLENLPTRNYEALRLKLIPAETASKILGLALWELIWLEDHGFIKGEGGLYDVISILMWLDSDEKPGGFNA